MEEKERKLLMIINPRAGRGKIRPQLVDIVDLFVKAGYQVTIRTTQGSDDAEHIVFQQAEAYDLLVCSGGDGTLSEVVRGLIRLEHPPVLGYIPSGSTNDFAVTLGLSKNMKQAAKDVIEGNVFRCDLGLLNEHPFLYVAAFGVFTDVSYKTPQNMKQVLGHLAYVVEGFKSFSKNAPNFEEFHLKIEYDDQELEGDFIYGAITNSKSVGGVNAGMSGGDLVELDDGIHEVLLVRAPRGPLGIQPIFNALVTQNLNAKCLCFFRTSKLKISSDKPMAWTRDGEYGGDHQEIEIKNLPRVIHLIRPQNAK